MQTWIIPDRGRRALALALLLGLVLAPARCFAARPARAAATFTVNRAGDAAGPRPRRRPLRRQPRPPERNAPCAPRSRRPTPPPGADTIRFNIPGGGLKTIRPASALPTITEPVTIDGYTQPGAEPQHRRRPAPTPCCGSSSTARNAGGGATGCGSTAPNTAGPRAGHQPLRAAAASTVIAGAATGVRIAGCFLGTDAAGTAARGNGASASRRRRRRTPSIGGAAPAARNLISGNALDGVVLGRRGAGTRVLGNLIGTDRTGAGPLGNGGDGVASSRRRRRHRRRPSPPQANVIAFNGGDGVAVVGDAPPATASCATRIFANGGLGIDLGDDGAPTPPPTTPATPTPARTPCRTRRCWRRAHDRGSDDRRSRAGSQQHPERHLRPALLRQPGGGDEGKDFLGQLNVVHQRQRERAPSPSRPAHHPRRPDGHRHRHQRRAATPPSSRRRGRWMRRRTATIP